MGQRLDHAAASASILMGAPGLVAEARDCSGIHDMSPERALGYIIGGRWPDLPEREAFAACARRYDVELPEATALPTGGAA